jgi:1-acyl-sn-glycerol-3-phosphate acyltransferase
LTAASHPWTKTSPRRATVVKAVVNVLFALLIRRRISGRDRIPPAGGCLLVFNHLSNLDPALLFAMIGRPDVTGLVAADYRQRTFHCRLVEAAGGLWLRRGASDRVALESALDLLAEGWMVGIAPEGRRSPTHVLIEGKRGAAFLATRANVPVVPVGVVNTDHVGRSLKRLRRPTVTVQVGEPFLLPHLSGESHRQDLQTCTDIIMCRIAALLPPEYRGVYADHPGLPAFLSET